MQKLILCFLLLKSKLEFVKRGLVNMRLKKQNKLIPNLFLAVLRLQLTILMNEIYVIYNYLIRNSK